VVELNEALDRIDEIRVRLAETERFRGYRALPVLGSGLLAAAAAAAQPAILPDPADQLGGYLGLWLGVAAVSVTAALVTMLLRVRGGAALDPDSVRLALGQFLPCLAAGAAVTAVLARAVPECAWLLPGLWQVLFSLGVFASARLLPPQALAVAAWYLGSGVACLAWARGTAAFSPWAMGLPFGAGQLASAAVLFWTLERTHDDDA
jgi:hypothetical protein